jgi:hypothetical protein
LSKQKTLEVLRMNDTQFENDRALFLGMFAGDGALPVKHNEGGYRNYVVCFYNTEQKYTLLFQKLFQKLTGIKPRIHLRQRTGRKTLSQIEKRSKKVFDLVHYDWEIPEGKKARNVFIPYFILHGSDDAKKNFFSWITSY